MHDLELTLRASDSLLLSTYPHNSVHFVSSLTYDTNIVSCGILKKEKDKIHGKRLRIILNGGRVIKKDYTFSMPGNLSVFSCQRPNVCSLASARSSMSSTYYSVV